MFRTEGGQTAIKNLYLIKCCGM